MAQLLPHRIHFLFIVFLIVSGMSFVSCSTGPTKEELAAKQKQERLADEQRRAEKLAAIKKEKLAAEKKAAEQEDAIQMKEIQIPASPESEKLTETESKLTPLAPKKVSTSLEIPTALDTYLITMEQKNISHPFYGIGDKRGFALNGEQGKYVIARRNHPLTFQVRTNPMHDFYISTSEKGWGAAAYRAGVSGQFTYNGNVTLTANSQTPDILYYGCRNHNSMGGKIVVVDEDADLAELAKKLDAEYARYAERSKIAIVKKVDPKTVKQKIAYVGMLVKFKGNRLSASQLDFVKEKLELAKSLEALGDMAGALGASQEAVVVFNTKASQVGPSEEELAEQKERFNDLLVTLEAFIDAHLASYKQAKEEGRKTVA
ncbi:MAG TPA: hypothetical protein ENK06_14035, partial [Gammaproteobacteria bacterium]|nr:hypothetical protein [Gammaproteobacteria bacterium]